MDGFYTTILTVASIILILMLTYVGILLYYAKSDEVFPPYQKPCPDYWDVDSSGKCIYPIANTARNLGELVKETDSTVANYDKKIKANLATQTPGVTQYSSDSDPTVIDFSVDGWKTAFNKPSPLCNKKAWADYFNIEWDGVTNTNQC